MHQMPDTRLQYNQFLLGQHLIHPLAYSGVTPVHFPFLLIQLGRPVLMKNAV